MEYAIARAPPANDHRIVLLQVPTRSGYDKPKPLPCLFLCSMVLARPKTGACRIHGVDPSASRLRCDSGARADRSALDRADSSRAVALNPESGKVYAVETRRSLVWIFDPQTESMSSVRVGAGPV